MDIIGKKYLYFAISLVIIIPGIISLFLFGLKLSIDFTGGSRITLSYPNKVSNETVKDVKEIFNSEKIKTSTVETSERLVIIRTVPLSQKQHSQLLSAFSNKSKDIKWEQFETIGPTIGKETTENAIKAVLLASILIVVYIVWSFRKVPKPASSFRFGVCAIIALVHDILVVIGVFSILGHFFGVEVDSLFVTALLTVIGFSVHDTIVVFDRIRENLRRLSGISFDKVVNESILETLGRSLNTSLTVVLVLVALLLFGGESIRWFVVTLLIGIISGTYSSIFNASPFLVVWHEKFTKR
ncbi:MAG: protein-export membrane protein SecF [Candidatus Levybacteria bacterium RIFCSPHIGHO2_02_FULL_37_13]|nr:MAG: protein-export membrane protein SecF [Candidatus Levybacteria bacterium RIFCSPHIGHO2_02_FULL_37_13]OGH30658.1 MAG: protein-export membrane protein SecF [Candidatus Levybacteria bacterium RIFCSPHIGHO2_12_FULL_37_9]OGH39654.1 MAG: protein-export membrane protein SecF [Candidatus Levybacteria bacterium RIFCSPLOWO2_01_FULL_37_26]